MVLILHIKWYVTQMDKGFLSYLNVDCDKLQMYLKNSKTAIIKTKDESQHANKDIKLSHKTRTIQNKAEQKENGAIKQVGQIEKQQDGTFKHYPISNHVKCKQSRHPR